MRAARGFGGRLSSRDERARAAAAGVARLWEDRSPGPARQRCAAASFRASLATEGLGYGARVLLDAASLTSLGRANPDMIAVFISLSPPALRYWALSRAAVSKAC